MLRTRNLFSFLPAAIMIASSAMAQDLEPINIELPKAFFGGTRTG